MISVQSTDRAPETLSKLWDQRDFPDVTLVSADGKNQIEAHKGILAASSPFFRNILLKNPHPKPLLYLGNLDQARLTSILQFIYLGQVCDFTFTIKILDSRWAGIYRTGGFINLASAYLRRVSLCLS